MGWGEKQLSYKRELCKILVRLGAMKFGAFYLSSGQWSPYYIDLRIIPSYPGAYRKMGEMYVELAKNTVNQENFLRVAGIPTAGIPFASILAFFLSKPFLYVRTEEKTHGRKRRVEGILYPGDKVLLVDDLVTRGGSLLRAADAIRSEGGVIADALVMVDRQEGGEKALAKVGIKLHSLVSISEVAQILYDMETITDEQLKDILKQIKKS